MATMKNPFATWTMAQVAEHNARVAGKSSEAEDKHTPQAVERERDLHDAIEDYCRSRGYLYRHDRMDRATTGQVGWADFTIFMPHKRCVLLECKAKGKKPTKEQSATLAHAANFGFVAKVVDNYDDAVRWIEAAASGDPVATEDAGPLPTCRDCGRAIGAGEPRYVVPGNCFGYTQSLCEACHLHISKHEESSARRSRVPTG